MANFRKIFTSAVVRKETEMVDMPDNSLPVPKYQQKQNETTAVKRARLLYQSRKRGMLENGILLSTFASEYLNNMNEHQLALYDDLINQVSNDWDIYYYATHVKPTPTEYDNEIMDLLKKHVKNEKGEKRYSQPDLVFNSV
jgi:succinate dehydrogenase assembly factor 2